MVLTGNARYGFAFICDDHGPIAVYLTPEDQGQGIDRTADLPTILSVRVDEAPIQEYQGSLDSVNSRLRVSADVDLDVVEDVRNARRRVAVALNVGESVYHEQSFRAVGSRVALGRFLLNCKDDVE